MTRSFFVSLLLIAGTVMTLSQPAAATRASLPVPPELRGRWAANFGPIVESCHPEFPDDFKWSITVDREQFKYWESRGTPSHVRQTAANRFVIDLDFVGEGNAWKERRAFTLADNGRTLIVDKAYPKMKLRELRYRRC